MRRALWSILAVLFLIETYSLLPVRGPEVSKSGSFPWVSGAIHVHSNYSTGSGTIEQIAQAAKTSGNDFVVITDLDTARARQDGKEKNYDGVDVFVEMEASTPSGHLLFFYSHTPAVASSDDSVRKLAYRNFLESNVDKGAFSFVAHPSHVKNPWAQLERFPDGLEVFNYDSLWQRQIYESKLKFFWTAFLYPFNPYVAALRFFEPYDKDFVNWDHINSLSPGHVGILGSDTGAKIRFSKPYPVAWPSYEEVFKLASNIIFLDEPLKTSFEERKLQIYRSLKKGKVAIAFQSIAPFAGNDFFLRCRDAAYRSGDAVPANADCRFSVKTPSDFPYSKRIKILKEGQAIQDITTTETEVQFPVEGPGTYRVEVWALPQTRFHFHVGRPVPYVFYNPIYVR